MKKFFKTTYILLLIAFLFSCSSVVEELAVKENATNSATSVATEMLQSKSVQQTQQVEPTQQTQIAQQAGSASDSMWQTDEEIEINRKYRDLKLKYSKHREDYSSDVVFANFRNVKLGKIKEGILYRGASSIDNSMGRAKCVDELIKEAKINFDIDLSDDEEKVKKIFTKKDFASEYFKSLYESGKTICLHMSTNYREQKYHDRVVKAMIAMSQNEGPYYIHCLEGKNRTGFVLAVIEGLAGASYDEMVQDHMTTFANYYEIIEESDKEKYDIIKTRYIDFLLKYLLSNDSQYANASIELKDADWVNVMHRYLTRNGMSEEDIENWYKNVTE